MKNSTDNTRTIYLTESSREDLFKTIYEKEKEGEDIAWYFSADCVEQYACGKTEEPDYAYRNLLNQLKKEYSEWKLQTQKSFKIPKEYVLNLSEQLYRKLPIVEKGNLLLAGFDSVGDIELIKYSGSQLHSIICNNHLNKFDYIITTEVKGIPIAQELSSLFGVPYICLRKEKKIYMGKTLEFDGSSITSGNSKYYLSESQAFKLNNMNVMFVDDVYSTGATMNLITNVCERLGCKLVCGAFILLEKECEGFEDSISEYYKYIEFCHNDVKCYAVGKLPLVFKNKLM